MRQSAAAIIALSIAGCATALRPDPTIDLAGRWTIVAVNGKATDGGPNFSLDLAPPTGSAQFGCNEGSGPVALGNGWVVPGEPWIATVAGCLPRSRMRFERDGFDILALPLAAERVSDRTVRLRNRRGSIMLRR